MIAYTDALINDIEALCKRSHERARRGSHSKVTPAVERLAKKHSAPTWFVDIVTGVGLLSLGDNTRAIIQASASQLAATK